MAHTVVAFFNSPALADQVVNKLIEAGLGEEHIVLVAEQFEGSEYVRLRTPKPAGDSLRKTGMTDAEAEEFAEGIRSGGVVVMVITQDEQVDRVVGIMESYGAVGLEESAAEPMPQRKAAAAHAEPAALPFDAHKKPLRERLGGVKTFVHVE